MIDALIFFIIFHYGKYTLLLLFRLGWFVFHKCKVKGGNQIERHDGGVDQAADDADAAAGAELRAKTCSERHRQHAADGGDGGHCDRAEFRFRRLEHGVVGGQSLCGQGGCFVHDENGVVDDDANHHDGAKHADH